MRKLIDSLVKIIRKSEFGKNSLIYILSTGIGGIITLFLMPYFSNNLSKNDFGVYENFTAIAVLLTSLILWGSDYIIVQYYKKDSEKNEYIQSFNVIICQLIFFLILACSLNIEFIKVNKLVVISAVFFSFFTALSQLLMLSLQLEKKANLFAIISLSSTIVGALLNLLLVYIFKDYWGRIFATLLITLITVLVVWIFFGNNKIKNFKFSFNHIKTGYIVGIPFFISIVAAWSLDKIDRFIISDKISVAEAGVYGVGTQLGMIVLLIKSAVTRAWMPYVIDNASQKKVYIKRMLHRLFLVFIVIAICVSVFGYFYIDFFINSIFNEAKFIVPIIAFAFCIDGIWSLYVNIAIYEKKYRVYSTITIIVGIINVFLNFLIIPKFGIKGAAFAKLFSYTFGAFLSWLYVEKYINWFKSKNL